MPSTKEWISENIRNGASIDENTYQSIADFCVMWALFEATELHDFEVAVDELVNVANRVSGKIKNIEDSLEFWKNRYIKDDEINHKFFYLNFTHKPHIDLVTQVLLGRETNQEKVIHALLLIVYRLRNNLFHGMKDITRMSKQATNLNTASDVVKNVLLASGRYIFINHA